MTYRKFKFSDGGKTSYDSAWMAEAKDYKTQVIKGSVVGETEQSGKLSDIVNLFSERFEELSKILRWEWGFHSVGTIKQAIETVIANEAIVLGPARAPGFDIERLEKVWAEFEAART